jgi:hypothetical protein
LRKIMCSIKNPMGRTGFCDFIVFYCFNRNHSISFSSHRSF